MKTFYIAQLVLGLLGATTLWGLKGVAAGAAFLLGTTLAALNVALLRFIWARVLGKKSVALTVFIIVLKYSLLSLVLYLIATKGLLPLEWFGLGLATILISVFRVRLGTF